MEDLENGLLKINELLEKIYNEITKTKQEKKRIFKIALTLSSPRMNKKKLDCIETIQVIKRAYLLRFLKEILDEDEIDYIITELNNMFNKNEEYIDDIKRRYSAIKNLYLEQEGIEFKDNLDENIVKYKLIIYYLNEEYEFKDLLCQYICNKYDLDYEP